MSNAIETKKEKKRIAYFSLFYVCPPAYVKDLY